MIWAKEHSLWVGDYIDNHVKESIEWSKKNYNLELINLSPEEYKLWHDKVSVLADEWKKNASKKGLPADQFFKDMMLLKAKYEKDFGIKP